MCVPRSTLDTKLERRSFSQLCRFLHHIMKSPYASLQSMGEWQWWTASQERQQTVIAEKTPCAPHHEHALDELHHRNATHQWYTAIRTSVPRFQYVQASNNPWIPLQTSYPWSLRVEAAISRIVKFALCHFVEISLLSLLEQRNVSLIPSLYAYEQSLTHPGTTFQIHIQLPYACAVREMPFQPKRVEVIPLVPTTASLGKLYLYCKSWLLQLFSCGTRGPQNTAEIDPFYLKLDLVLHIVRSKTYYAIRPG